MTAKTPAERQAALKLRRTAAGLVKVSNLWCKPQDVNTIKAIAKLSVAATEPATKEKSE